MNQAGGEAMNCDSRAARAVGLAKAEKTDDGTPVSLLRGVSCDHGVQLIFSICWVDCTYSAAMLVGGAISAEREEMEDRMAEREGLLRYVSNFPTIQNKILNLTLPVVSQRDLGMQQLGHRGRQG